MDLTTSRIGVTGAGGFIGRALCERLVADGATVAGLDVAPGAEQRVTAAGAEFRLADTTDADGVAAALADCNGVIHTAAIVSDWGPMADFVRVNVGGTRNVLDAAEAAGAERVVHVSSVAVWGYEFHHDISEDAKPRQAGAPYIDTKAASHTMALRRGAAVVRPGDVYGPGSIPWAVRPLEAMRAGRFFLPGKGEGLMTPVYIDDLVDCIVRALVHPGAGGQAFTAWDGHAVTAAEFFGHYARMLGRDHVRTLPLGVIKLAALAQELQARAAGRAPQVSRQALTYLSRRATYPNARAREILGWSPAIELPEGMRRTENWFRDQELLP
jgi:nucleoside-diphosphate-sugar epimerase